MPDYSERDRQVRRVILIEGSANFAVLLAKLWVGLTTGSLAVLGDAIHSLTDVSNNIIAWIVIRLSCAPPDREHPYGHRKFETLAVFSLASLLVVLAFELAFSAVTREAQVVYSTPLDIAVMAAVLAVNISLASWQRLRAHKLHSDILFADASHTFADVMTTIVVIAGWQLSAHGYLWLDRACALAVAILVFYLAYSLFKRVLPVLIDRFAIDPELLTKAVAAVEGVQQVKRARSRWIGNEIAIDLVVSVDPALSTDHSHRIASAIEQLLLEKFSVKDVSIHVEPHNNHHGKRHRYSS